MLACQLWRPSPTVRTPQSTATSPRKCAISSRAAAGARRRRSLSRVERLRYDSANLPDSRGAYVDPKPGLSLVLRPHSHQVGGRFRHQVEGRGLALACEHLPTCGIEVEQEFAPGGVADEAAGPADRGEPFSASHLADAVQRGGGIGDERTCRWLERLFSRRALDHEF